MEVFKILKSTTPTNTFMVTSLDVVFSSLADASVLHCYAILQQMYEKIVILKKKNVWHKPQAG